MNLSIWKETSGIKWFSFLSIPLSIIEELDKCQYGFFFLFLFLFLFLFNLYWGNNSLAWNCSFVSQSFQWNWRVKNKSAESYKINTKWMQKFPAALQKSFYSYDWIVPGRADGLVTSRHARYAHTTYKMSFTFELFLIFQFWLRHWKKKSCNISHDIYIYIYSLVFN